VSISCIKQKKTSPGNTMLTSVHPPPRTEADDQRGHGARPTGKVTRSRNPSQANKAGAGTRNQNPTSKTPAEALSISRSACWTMLYVALSLPRSTYVLNDALRCSLARCLSLLKRVPRRTAYPEAEKSAKDPAMNPTPTHRQARSHDPKPRGLTMLWESL